ncbi:hypothetical protein QF036_002716 [Arthrobacter globiformis]|nr:hypothetical protein [Arthrobacter globiformis]
MSLMSGPRTAATMQNSVAPGGRGFLRGLDQFGDVEPDAADGGVEQAGLAAEVAVLRAAAGLDGDDALHLDVFAAVPEPDLVGKLQGRGKGLVREAEDFLELRLAEPDAVLEDLPAGDFQDGEGLWEGSVACGFARVCLNRH